MSHLITSFFKSPPPTETTSSDAPVSMTTGVGEDEEPLSQASSQHSSECDGNSSRRGDYKSPLVVNLIGLLGAENSRHLKEGGKREKDSQISRENGLVFTTEHHYSIVKVNGNKDETKLEVGGALPGMGVASTDEIPPQKGEKRKKRKKKKMKGHVSLSELEDTDSTVSLAEGDEQVARVSVARRGSGYLIEECMVIESDQGVVWLSPLKRSPQKPAGTLCNAWATVFNKAPSSSLTTPPSSPRHSPSRRKCSPLRQCSTRPSPAASPLKKTQSRRQLPFTGQSCQTTPTIAVSLDFAPYEGLVHVQQRMEPGTAQYWSLGSAAVPRLSAAGGKESGMARRPESSGSSSLGLMSSEGVATSRNSWQHMEVVSAEDRERALADLVQNYPDRSVTELYSRYTAHHSSQGHHPHPLHSSHGHHPHPLHSSQGHHPHPLTCSINICRKRNRRGFKVDTSAYTKQKNTRRTLKRRVKSKPVHVERSPSPENPLHYELWTEVYRPKNAREVLGNRLQVEQLKAWLTNWFERGSQTHSATIERTCADQKSKSKRVVFQKDDEVRGSSLWDTSGDSDFISLRHMTQKGRVKKCFHDHSSESEGSDSDEEGFPPRAVVLCGPHGSGKTAAVYACAGGLGFKVFEVNPGVVRSRPLLLSTLREATLSHQVAISNSKVAASNSQSRSSSKKPHVKSPTDLHSFFKPKPDSTFERGRASVTLATNTVILLEEVDVVFDEDKGFWLAVSEIVMATRRPIVLTCSDPRLSPEFPHQRIEFARPAKVDLSLQLQLLGLANSVLIGQELSNQIAEQSNCDIRKAINHLQLCTSWLPSNCCQDNQKSCDAVKNLLQPLYLHTPWQNQFLKRVKIHPTYSSLDTVAHTLDSLSELDHLSRGDCHRTMTGDHMTKKPWWCSVTRCGLSDTLPLTSHDTAVRGLTSDITMATDSLLNSAYHVVPDSQRIADVNDAHVTCLDIFSLNLSGSHVAMVTECLPVLRLICQCENVRETSNTKRRYQHYLSACSVDLQTLQRYGTLNLFPPAELNQ